MCELYISYVEVMLLSKQCPPLLYEPFNTLPIYSYNFTSLYYTVCTFQGENLNSLSSEFYSVAVGSGSCAISFIADTQVRMQSNRINSFGDEDMNNYFSKIAFSIFPDQLYPSP